MKKILIALVLLILVGGCSASYELKEGYSVLPPELKDCKVWYLTNSSGGGITVMRCPNSTTSTTYTSGKAQVTTVVIDGVEYVKKK